MTTMLRQMRRNPVETALTILAILAMVVMVITMSGCGPLSQADVKNITQASGELKSAASDLHLAADGMKADPSPVVQKAGQSVEKAANNIDKGTAVVDGVVASAAQPGASLVSVIAGGADAAVKSGALPPDIAGYVKLGLFGLGVLEYFRQRAKVANEKAASTQMQSAVSAAIGAGKMQILPGATATADALVVANHGPSDLLIDTIKANEAVNLGAVGMRIDTIEK